MPRKPTYWVGGGQNIEPQTDASTSTGSVIKLLPALPRTGNLGRDNKVIIEAIYLHFAIKRIFVTDFDALAFLVWVANVTETSDLPVQTINALSLDSRMYANRAIMMAAPLPVPRNWVSGDLATATAFTGEVLVAHHEFQASRKVDLASNVVSLILNSDVSVVTSVFCQWRMLCRQA